MYHLSTKPPLKAHANVTSGVRDLTIDPSLQLHPFTVYTSSEGSCDSANLRLSPMRQVPTPRLLVHRKIKEKLTDEYGVMILMSQKTRLLDKSLNP